jgi:low temperature requirement protein LtrA
VIALHFFGHILSFLVFFKAGSNFDDYLGVFVAFLTMYTIKNIYFGSDAKEEDHALEEEGHPGSVLWVIMHFPLAFCLLGCGVAYKLLFTTIHESSPEGNIKGSVKSQLHTIKKIIIFKQSIS